MRIPHYNGIILFESHECKCFRSLNRYDDEELSVINRKQNSATKRDSNSLFFKHKLFAYSNERYN